MSGNKNHKEIEKDYANYQYGKADRPNLPTNEMADEMEIQDISPKYYTAPRRQGDDPQLKWDRRGDPNEPVQHRPLFIQEKVHPSALIRSLRREIVDPHMTLFKEFNGLTDEQYTQWYQHKARWQNRLIHGNATEVCASLADREGLAGKVQMIYLDPPYGIKYKSNFAIEAGQSDGDESQKQVGADPRSVKAFLDTWEYGVHSYLDAIHKHAVMAYALLADTGSIFLQIGDENMMRVGMVLDEVFGAENRIATITFSKSGSTSSSTLSSTADYILWYGKDRSVMKFHQIYEPFKNRKELIDMMDRGQSLETEEETRPLRSKEKEDPSLLSDKAVLFRDVPLASSGKTGNSNPYEWNGRVFPCPSGEHWRVSHDGLDRLAEKNRLYAGSTATSLLRWKQYEHEFPGRRVNNVWARTMSPSDKRYVVQTADSVVERCMLMSTDPGDLVLDFTCGSGTTPFIAEKWGRRWIAIDASQVAIATARTRLATSLFDYHAISDTSAGKLAEEALRENAKLKSIKKPQGKEEMRDPAQGFVYRRVPNISAGILAYDLEDETPPIYLVDQPVKIKGITRVCSPFTVESDSPHRYIDIAEAVSEEPAVRNASAEYYTSHQRTRAETLEHTGIRCIDGAHLEVENLEDCLDAYPLTHIATYRRLDDSEDVSKRMAIAFAPDDATVSVGLMRAAGKAARNQLGRDAGLVVVCGFAFDPDTSDVKSHINLPIARVQMNRQFQIEEVKIEKADDNAFVMLGEPDVELTRSSDGYRVEIKGFATFNPTSGNAEFGRPKDIYSWLLDTDYDGRSFFARRMHFPGQHNDKHIKKLRSELANVLDNEAYEAMLSHKSMPFPRLTAARLLSKLSPGLVMK